MIAGTGVGIDPEAFPHHAFAALHSLAHQRLLTPLLVQQSMIDKLSAKIQLMVVPQGQNFLMQLPASGAK